MASMLLLTVVERRLIAISGGSCLTPRRLGSITTTRWLSRPLGIDHSTVILFLSPSYRSVVCVLCCDTGPLSHYLFVWGWWTAVGCTLWLWVLGKSIVASF